MADSYQITETRSGMTFRCTEEQSVLVAMTRQGCNCVPVGCKGGGCGFCKVVVLSGEYECGKMSKLHAPPEAIQQGKVLACRIYPLTDLVIEHRAEPGD